MVCNIILLAFSLSVDSLGIGISYGLRDIKLSLQAKAIIGTLSLVITTISLLLGKWITYLLPPVLATAIGISMLLIMGIYIMANGVSEETEAEKKNKKKVIHNPLVCDLDNSNHIDLIEAIYLGLALSIDSFGVGISSAVAGMSSIIIPISAGLFQILFLYLGELSGKRLRTFDKVGGSIWSLISGSILIIIAVVRMMFS